MTTPNESDEYERIISEAYAAQQDEKAPPKPFVHRTMPESRCPKCNLVVKRSGRLVCLASGKTIVEDSGLANCAFDPRPQDEDNA